MAEVVFPILLLTDKTLFGELSALFANTARQLTTRAMPNAILIYEVCDAPEWAHGTVKGSPNPDRMLVMTLKPESREAIARALAAVAERHPQVGDKRKTSLSVKDSMPLRNFFKQMAEVPLTVFNLSHAKAPGSSLFFLRTPEVVADFKQELPKALIAGGAGAGSNPTG